MEIDVGTNAEEVFHKSIRRISVDSSYEDNNSQLSPKMSAQVIIPTSEDVLTVEMMKNIEMLKSINFIQHLNFSVQGDKVILNKACGFAIGDYITNRHLSYEDKFGIHQRNSRIHDDHWPSVLSTKCLESMGVHTTYTIFNSL